MIKLISPFNYHGVIIEAGQSIGFLPQELQQKLIDGGAAEEVEFENTDDGTEKPLEKMTKAELLELAVSLGVEGVSEKNNKDEIIAGIKAHE